MNDCCWVLKQLPHSYLSLPKEKVSVWFTLNWAVSPALYLILNVGKQTAFALQFGMNKAEFICLYHSSVHEPQLATHAM